MIKSMTGYGRGRVLADGLDITFEIKSVNNRYMDLNIRMPRAFAPLEEGSRRSSAPPSPAESGRVYRRRASQRRMRPASLNREYLRGYLAVLGQVGKNTAYPAKLRWIWSPPVARCSPARRRRTQKIYGRPPARRWTPSPPCAARRANLRRPARPSRRPGEIAGRLDALRPRRCAAAKVACAS